MRGKWWLTGYEPAYTRATATTLLLWTRSLTSPYSRLSLNVLTEVADYFHSHSFLVSLGENSLRVFDCTMREWQPSITLSSALDCKLKGHRAVVLIDGRVLCCGGRYNQRSTGLLFTSKNAYLITRGGSLSVLPSMLNDRHSHGLIEYNQVIYVFGGSNSHIAVYPLTRSAPCYLRDCEQLRRNCKWTEMPKMKENRTEVSVCIHREVMYISGFGSVLIEAFSPLQRAFTACPININCISTCLVSTSNFLLAYSNSTIVRLEESQGRLREVGKRSCEGCRRVSECPIVLDRSEKWAFYSEDGKAYMFEVETGGGEVQCT